MYRTYANALRSRVRNVHVVRTMDATATSPVDAWVRHQLGAEDSNVEDKGLGNAVVFINNELHGLQA